MNVSIYRAIYFKNCPQGLIFLSFFTFFVNFIHIVSVFLWYLRGSLNAVTTSFVLRVELYSRIVNCFFGSAGFIYLLSVDISYSIYVNLKCRDIFFFFYLVKWRPNLFSLLVS